MSIFPSYEILKKSGNQFDLMIKQQSGHSDKGLSNYMGLETQNILLVMWMKSIPLSWILSFFSQFLGEFGDSLFVFVCELEGQSCWSHELFSSWCEHVLHHDPKAASIQPCHHGLSSEHCSFHISFLCCPRASSFFSWCSNPQDTQINHLHSHLKLQCAISVPPSFSEENVSELHVQEPAGSARVLWVADECFYSIVLNLWVYTRSYVGTW